MNRLMQEWYREHADRYPEGASVTAEIGPDGSMTLSIKEPDTAE